MMEANVLLRALQCHGISWLSGVPCSELGALLGELHNTPTAHYVAAANEGDAVALLAGATLAGRLGCAFMQNSGLGNAVNPLSSLTHTLRIPMLLLVTLRGTGLEPDEPQHELMGRITERMLRDLEIPCARLPSEPADLDRVLDVAMAHLYGESRPYALLVPRKSVTGGRQRTQHPPVVTRIARAPVRHDPPGLLHARPSRREALDRIIECTPPERSVVISTTGYTSRELYALEDRASHLYVVGSMGCASSLALGVALARPDVRVVVIDGDGALLMRPSALAMIGSYAGRNLVHVVLDNGQHESTGGQASLSSSVALAELARACGYARCIESTQLDAIPEILRDDGIGPRFLALGTRAGTPAALPRPRVSPEQVHARFSAHLRTIAPPARSFEEEMRA